MKTVSEFPSLAKEESLHIYRSEGLIPIKALWRSDHIVAINHWLTTLHENITSGYQETYTQSTWGYIMVSIVFKEWFNPGTNKNSIERSYT